MEFGVSFLFLRQIFEYVFCSRNVVQDGKILLRNGHTGSVLGKHKFDIPFLVAQSGRSVAGVVAVVDPMDVVLVREAMSFGGQVRFVPALMDKVGWPH